jgi:hypothetical protein
MKEPWDWDENDLLRLITDQVQESLTLDYKLCDALQKTDGKKNEVSKDISAFANSAGGTIVYGMAENKHVPTDLDVGFDPNDITKEWLEQVINSRIQRRIDGIRINQIQLSGAKVGRVVYVVSIPQSTHAPHMAHDRRFYKRFNFGSNAMEEYEVRDVSRRLISPDLFISFGLQAGSTVAAPEYDPSKNYPPFSIEVTVGNASPAPADFSLLRYYIDRRLNPDREQDNVAICEGSNIPVCSQVIEWRGNLRLPIWESARFQLGLHRVTPGRSWNRFYLFWDAQAPLMPRKAGAFVLTIVNDVPSISVCLESWRLEKEVYCRV